MKTLAICLAILLTVSACQTTSGDQKNSSSHIERFTRLEKELEAKNWRDPHSLNRLGAVKFFLKKYAEAESLHTISVAFYNLNPKDRYPNLAYSLLFLALAKAEQGKFSEAALVLNRGLLISEKALNPKHPCLVPFLEPLAQILRDKGDVEKASAIHKRAASIEGQCESPDIIRASINPK